jgi:hypothetical protein
MVIHWRCLVVLLIPAALAAQQKSEFEQILERLTRLEQENRNLAQEVRMLREELAVSRTIAPSAPAAEQAEGGTPAAAAPLDERVAVVERRVEEQAQTKVETGHRMPVTLTGMALFNAFLNGRASGGQQNPTTASPVDNLSAGGASLSQSVVGLKFQGPEVRGGGQVSGSLYMDFFAGTSSSLNHLLRLRVATVQVDWKNQSIMAGQDKPIISPREPTSLAQVGVSPLTGAGNPWLWQPQVRFEQRFSLGEQAGVRAQVGIYQTSELSYTSRGGEYAAPPSAPRPALEGRFEFWRQFAENRRIEIAPGFHTSATHVAGDSIPSDLFSLDWLIQPLQRVQLTGMFFHGENAAGIGALRQGFTVFPGGRDVAIGVSGGWAQLSLQATRRLSLNIYGGQESDRTKDLLAGDISRNLAYAGNVIYRLGPNVLLGLEASQVRTNYFHRPNRLNNHYDLAVGYLF